MIASAGEPLETEELRQHSGLRWARRRTGEQRRKIGHFRQFWGGLRHNPRHKIDFWDV